MVNNDNFRTVEPYIPGDQPDFADMVKLNTNENPYPPSPAVAEAAKGFNCDTLRLYPPVDSGRLKSAIAAYHGVDRDCVFTGVGSDDVLAVIFQSCFNSGRRILFPEISYSFYEVWADMFRVPFTKVPLREDFTIEPDDYIPLGRDAANGGVIICNPNAPTSIAMPLESIERIVAANQGSIVVVDEAYVDFGAETAMPLLKEYDNLIVVRTFSKSRSMAGVRIGYAVASPVIIQAMDSIKNSMNSYTMNRPAIELGCASLGDEPYFREQVDRIMATRQRMITELDALGFTTLPSSANFIFTTHETIPARDIFAQLKEKHIFVRYFPKPGIDNFLRITVGTEEQTDILIREMKEITQKVI